MKRNHKGRKPHASQRAKKIVSTKIPQGVFTTQITELLTDGRGLSKIDGKAVMISGGLPDERVEFEYTQQKKQLLSGQVTHVLAASEYRVTPRCQVFEQCGGCVLQHLSVQRQIDFKAQQLLSNLHKQAKVKPKNIAEPLMANPWGYRRRARVGIKKIHGEERVHVGFRAGDSAYLVNITRCEVLAPQLSALLSPIADVVTQMSQPDSISQVEMTLGDSGVALSFRHVLPLSTEDKVRFKQFARQFDVTLYLQPKDAASVHGLAHNKTITYQITVRTEQELAANSILPTLQMVFLPYHFTQVNFDINQKMLKQAIEWLDIQPDDCILDLFCGLGNFTLPMAQRAKQVVGIEGSRALVEWAKQNAMNNQIDNAHFYQADLTQDTQMMTWRVKQQYNKLLIDPPRAGALDILPLIHVLKPERICYVSCHPATLARDIDILVNRYGYRLRNVGVMDMFPHTAHVESMALLVKK